MTVPGGPWKPFWPRFPFLPVWPTPPGNPGMPLNRQTFLKHSKTLKKSNYDLIIPWTLFVRFDQGTLYVQDHRFCQQIQGYQVYLLVQLLPGRLFFPIRQESLFHLFYRSFLVIQFFQGIQRPLWVRLFQYDHFYRVLQDRLRPLSDRAHLFFHEGLFDQDPQSAQQSQEARNFHQIRLIPGILDLHFDHFHQNNKIVNDLMLQYNQVLSAGPLKIRLTLK